MNYKMYGTPLSITSNGLNISFDELISMLNNKFKELRLLRNTCIYLHAFKITNNFNVM